MYEWPPRQIAGRAQANAAAGPRAPAGTLPSAGLPQQLKDRLLAMLPRSRVVLPGDPGYEDASPDFNPRFDDRRPGGIVFCISEAEVAACLEGVQAWAVRFRIRSGGHSLAGHSTIDGGLVIDVSGLHAIRLDPAGPAITVGSGCRLRDVQKAIDAAGFCLPLGGDDVGVAGYMLGGGFGLTSRTLGMNSDHVSSARVLLADGRTVRASESVNRDLWWALRGGTGGNFGVLLEVVYALQRRPPPKWRGLNWVFGPGEWGRAAEVLRIAQDEVLRGSGPELNVQADVRFQTAAGTVQRDVIVVSVWGGYFGPQEELDALMQPLHAVPNAIHQGQRAHIAVVRVAKPVLRRSRLVSNLPAAAWAQLVDEYVAHANPNASITLEAWDGAIAAYPRDKSAFIHRDARFNIYVTSFWDGPAEEAQMRAYLERFHASLAPFWTGGVYQNFADTDVPDYRKNYWGQAWPALLAVKRKYDPKGVFEFSQAVEARPGEPQDATWPADVVSALACPVQAETSPRMGSP